LLAFPRHVQPYINGAQAASYRLRTQALMQAEILALRHQLIVLQRNANDKADYPRDVQNIIRGRVRSNAFVNAKAKIQANVLLSQDQQLRKAREDESLVTARLSRCVGRDFADYCTSDRSGPIATVSVNIQVPRARALWISRRRSSAREELAFPDRET